MKLGAVFPQTEIGNDPSVVRDFAQAVEGLGFDYILCFDHVLGANAESRPGWSGPYRHTDAFHEPFVLYGYLAAVTSRVRLMTGILILPQRQTALVAKQAAAVDVLSQGRMHLGIGIGWNPVEYEALGEDFTNRGRRSEEQIALLRALWTRELVTFEGKWHKVVDAGLNPLPVQRPIPLWLGGRAEAVLERIGRIGDGWHMGVVRPDEAHLAMIARLRDYTREAGRAPADLGIEAWITMERDPPDAWPAMIAAWKEAGVTHLALNTMRVGCAGSEGHLAALKRFKEMAV